MTSDGLSSKEEPTKNPGFLAPVTEVMPLLEGSDQGGGESGKVWRHEDSSLGHVELTLNIHMDFQASILRFCYTGGSNRGL